MTNLNDIKAMLESCIPKDMLADGLIDTGLLKMGVIDACSALEIKNLVFKEEPSFDPDEEPSVVIEPELSLSQQRLAGYFCYILYLEKLKLSLNQDAINFSTLTFSIKGLEKRAEAIGDQIYITRRYLESEINRINGSSAILGVATQFGNGGETNG